MVVFVCSRQSLLDRIAMPVYFLTERQAVRVWADGRDIDLRDSRHEHRRL
jgi:hypothetical protein